MHVLEEVKRRATEPRAQVVQVARIGDGLAPRPMLFAEADLIAEAGQEQGVIHAPHRACDVGGHVIRTACESGLQDPGPHPQLP